jgi:hypothetical protein
MRKTRLPVVRNDLDHPGHGDDDEEAADQDREQCGARGRGEPADQGGDAEAGADERLAE